MKQDAAFDPSVVVDRPAVLAVVRRESFALVWACRPHEAGFEHACVLLLHDEGDAWVELPFLMVSGEEDLPWPRPQREWEDWGPACWLVEETHSSHPALKVDHRDHEHEVPVLDQDLLVIGGVTALDVSTIEVQLEGATHTITVDRQTGVFLGVLNSTDDPTLIARFTDGSTEFL